MNPENSDEQENQANFAAQTVIAPEQIIPATTDQSAPVANTTTPELAPSPLAIQGGQIQTTTPQTSSPKKKYLIIAVILLLFGGVGGYIFGFYLPNQPENVWQSGLSNSGKAINKIVDDLTTSEKMELLKKTEITASVEVSGAEFDFTGTASSKLDGNKSVSSAKFTSNQYATQELNLNIDVMTDIADGKLYPNIYLKIAGLKSFDEESLFGSFNKYDDKWITVSSSYLESINQTLGETLKEKPDAINSGDVAEFVKTVSTTSNEYLFTSNKDKSVLVNKGFKGKETVNGIQTFHYEVGIDKDHVKDYCKVLTNRIYDLALTKKLSSSNEEAIEKQKEEINKDCESTVNSDLKDDETFDAWIDSKYKIFHKIRLYEKEDKTKYTEFGQIYKGGSELSVFFASHDDSAKSDAKLVMDINTKTIASKGTFTAKSNLDNGHDIKATIAIRPYSGEVKVEKPAGAIDIQTLLSFDSEKPVNSSPTSNKAKDTERQTDIQAIQGYIEAYYAQEGFYPTLTNLNDVNWRKTNMTGLDNEAMKDPDGTYYSLTPKASSYQYGYEAGGCANSQCQSYTLEALLSSGSRYSKASLNYESIQD